MTVTVVTCSLWSFRVFCWVLIRGLCFFLCFLTLKVSWFCLPVWPVCSCLIIFMYFMFSLWCRLVSVSFDYFLFCFDRLIFLMYPALISLPEFGSHLYCFTHGWRCPPVSCFVMSRHCALSFPVYRRVSRLYFPFSCFWILFCFPFPDYFVVLCLRNNWSPFVPFWLPPHLALRSCLPWCD